MSNFIRVLRNGALYANRKEAIDTLKGKLATLQDGEICIASYGDNNDWSTAKTVLGVVRFKDSKRSYTIFDNEDIAGIMATIEKLDATVRGNLTDADVVKTDKHVGVKVVEVDGKLTEVTVVESDIASAKLLGNLGDGSSVESAFGRIAKEAEERATAITGAIAGLHSVVTPSNDHSVLTGLTQANGVLTAKTEITLANVAITGSAADVANAAVDGIDGETVSAQITSIAEKLNDITTTQANALKYRTVQLTSEEVTALSDSNVKEAYKVVSYTGTWTEGTSTGNQVGDVIKIYKDSSVKEIYLGSGKDEINTSTGDITKAQTVAEADLSLNYAYMNADGTYGMAKIPVANFLREAEFKNGLQVINGEVSVKVDTTSEGFLTVGKDGVKLSGVQTAIDNKITALDADVTGKSTDDHVTVQVIEKAGKVTNVNVTTSGLALDSDVIKGVTVNGVDAQVSAEKKAIVTINGANTAVSNAYVATKYAEPFETKVGTNHIAADDTVDAAFKKTENTISVLATEVISNEKVTTAAVSKLAESAGVAGANGVIGYQRKTDANYISAATSVHDATVKLDDAIKTVDNKITTLDGAALKTLNGSEAITVSGDTANSKTVSLKLDSVKTDNALTVNANGLYLSNVWDCGEY